MKKTAILAISLLLAAGTSMMTSCQNGTGTTPAADKATPSEVAGETAVQINIRYVDGDSIMANYNLAKDVQEFILQTHSRIDNAQQSRATEIQRLAAQIEEKVRNNSYLTEASYNADMAKLQKMQQDAEAYIGSMQRNASRELDGQQQQLNDSIEAFIKEFNKDKGYDAILFKTAGIYFNPALDITDEVVEGLNKRYNRISK